MLAAPRLKASLTRAVVDGDKLFLLDERRHVLLEGRTAALLAPLLDGRRSVDEVLAELGEEPLTEVLRALEKLERLGHLAEGGGSGDDAADAFWDAVGVPPALAAERLAATAVTLHAVGGVALEGIEGALAGAGLRLGPGGLDVVVTDDYLADGLAERNRLQLGSGRPWLLARPAGMRLWLGPYFRPRETACWACLAERLAGNRQLESYLAAKNGSATVARASTPRVASSAQAAAGLLALELETIIADGRSTRLRDDLVTIDLFDFSLERHSVVRLPQCPLCGDPELQARREPRVTLQRRPKRFTADGGHRTCQPEETYARLARQVSPLTGAVTSVTRQTIFDSGVAYSYASGHNFALMQDSMYFLRKNLRGRSGGKGRTDAQAKVGAICEAIERFNAIWRGDEPRRRASWEALGADAIHPEALTNFSARQYAERESWNAAQLSGYHLVPERLEPGRPIDWSTVWSLTHDAPRLVPSAYCYFGHPDMGEHFFCASDANGSAAGNTLEEAVLQGLMELVERDAVALWWYNRARRPALDLDSFGEPYVDALREHYASLGRELWVLDLTTDLGIPAFAGVSRRVDRAVQDVVLGFGAHVDPSMALLRALTEVNQFLPAVSDVHADGSTNYWMDDPDALAWWTTATPENQPYIAADESRASVTAQQLESLSSDDIAADVRACVARLEGRGQEVLVLDQTRPDIDLAVVKVISPGLRHFWRRLGPGRLYEQPAALGWQERVLAEEELNPISIFF